MKLLPVFFIAISLMFSSCAERPDSTEKPEFKKSQEEIYGKIKEDKFFGEVSLGSGYSTGKDFTGNFLTLTIEADSIPASRKAMMNHARKAARLMVRNVKNIQSYEFIEVSIVESGIDELFYTGSTHDFRFRVKEFLKKGIG